MGSTWSQFFPPKPTFTDHELPDQSGKVFIVTGGASGVGRELVKMLYGKHGTVYIAARSQTKSEAAIVACRAAHPTSRGRLEFLPLDLGDLDGIRASADAFLQRESRLDVLWNNAGVMVPPEGTVTKQGYELQLGTNVLGPFLFTRYLLPLLHRTAASAPPSSVRVAWAGSLVIELNAPPGGIDMANLNWTRKPGNARDKYAQSKTGNLFLASEFARRGAGGLIEAGAGGAGTGAAAVVHVAFNPGNLKTELQRHLPAVVQWLISLPLYHARFGAYTELYAGLAPSITAGANNGAYVIPWGRVHVPRKDIAQALRAKGEQGVGTGVAALFWEWCEKETTPYGSTK